MTAPGPKSGSARVILVEDHEEMRRALATVLAASGLQVLATLPCGDNLLQIVREQKPDLIVLDIFLPGQSGLELARQLRANRFDMPLIFISSNSEAELVESCHAIGRSGFVAKPRLATDLGAALSAALG